LRPAKKELKMFLGLIDKTPNLIPCKKNEKTSLQDEISFFDFKCGSIVFTIKFVYTFNSTLHMRV